MYIEAIAITAESCACIASWSGFWADHKASHMCSIVVILFNIIHFRKLGCPEFAVKQEAGWVLQLWSGYRAWSCEVHLLSRHLLVYIYFLDYYICIGNFARSPQPRIFPTIKYTIISWFLPTRLACSKPFIWRPINFSQLCVLCYTHNFSGLNPLPAPAPPPPPPRDQYHLAPLELELDSQYC